MTENKYALTGWKQGSTISSYDLELPSGQFCLVKKLKMERIIELGLMDDLDSFTGTINDNKKRGKKAQATADEANVMEMMKDSTKFGKMMATVDKVVLDCVMEPKIWPATDQARSEDAVYVDNIDFSDKLAIFTSVFDGLGQMADFRAGQEGNLGDMAKG